MIFLIRNSHFDLYYLYSNTKHSQPDVEVILEKMADVKRQQKTQKDYKEWKKQNQNNETNSD